MPLVLTKMCQNCAYKKLKLLSAVLLVSMILFSLSKISQGRLKNKLEWHRSDNLNVSHYLSNSETFLKPPIENLGETIIFIRYILSEAITF